MHYAFHMHTALMDAYCTHTCSSKHTPRPEIGSASQDGKYCCLFALAQQQLERVYAFSRVYMRQYGCAHVRPCSWAGFDQVSCASALPQAACTYDTKITDYSPHPR